MSAIGQTFWGLARRYPIAVFGGTLNLLLVGILLVRFGNVSDASLRLSEASEKGARIQANVKLAARLDEQTGAVKHSLETINQRTVQADLLAQNLQYFYRLQSETEVTLIDLRQQDVSARKPAPKNAPPSAFYSQPFNVAVQGEFADVMRFLQKVEGGSLLGRVTQATLRPADNGKVTLSFVVELLGKS